jgi:hypothetical protein
VTTLRLDEVWPEFNGVRNPWKLGIRAVNTDHLAMVSVRETDRTVDVYGHLLYGGGAVLISIEGYPYFGYNGDPQWIKDKWATARQISDDFVEWISEKMT